MGYELPLTADQIVQFHGEITTYAGMRAVATVGMQINTTFCISINDSAEFWMLRAKAGGEADDGVSFLLPADYNGSTNNVIWVRTK